MPSAGRLSCTMRRATSIGSTASTCHALRPPPEQARDARDHAGPCSGTARATPTASTAPRRGRGAPRAPSPAARRPGSSRARRTRRGAPRARRAPRPTRRRAATSRKSRRRSSYIASEPGGAEALIALGSQSPIARDSAMTQRRRATARARSARRASARATSASRSRGAPRCPPRGRRARAPSRAAPGRARTSRGAARGPPTATKLRTCSRRASRSAWRVAPMIAATSVGTMWRFGCTGTSSPRRSSEKPTPRRDGVAPVAVRRRSGSRSSSRSSSVSASPPSRSTASSTRRSVAESFSISSASFCGSPRTSHAVSSDSAMGGVAGRPR